jgi:hypothetical protein
VSGMYVYMYVFLFFELYLRWFFFIMSLGFLLHINLSCIFDMKQSRELKLLLESEIGVYLVFLHEMKGIVRRNLCLVWIL